jgi:hypothetical protein
MTEDERRALLWPGLTLPERVCLCWLVAQCGVEGRGMAMAELRAVTGLSDRPAREAVATLLRRGLVQHEGYSLGQPKLRMLSVPWLDGHIAMRLPAAGLKVSKPAGPGRNTPPRAIAHVPARVSRVTSSSTPGSAQSKDAGRTVAAGAAGMPVPCPANFQPTAEVAATIAERWPALHIAYEVANFTLYFAVEHPMEKRRGWQRSFMAWCERSASRPARASAGPFRAAASPAGRRQSGGEWLDDVIGQLEGSVIEGDRDE